MLLERPPKDVAAAFDAMPADARDILLNVRDLVAEEAKSPDVGDLEECLKWGQPSYVTRHPKTGTTLRLACTKAGEPALFTHCQSGVMEAFRSIAPKEVEVRGNRAAVLEIDKPFPRDAVSTLIRLALTYHLDART